MDLVNSLNDRLLFAVPKKGRLYERVLKLLAGAGLKYSRPNRLDLAQCEKLPITLVFLPAADIAKYVGEGNVDLGITGEDIVKESGVPVETLMQLGMGKCRLCVQGPKGKFQDPKELLGQRIVTSFPNIAREFFDGLEGKESKEEGSTKIKYVRGSVEAAIGLGLADGIVDLVETGTTMRAAGLEVVHSIMSTQTVLSPIPTPRTRS